MLITSSPTSLFHLPAPEYVHRDGVRARSRSSYRQPIRSIVQAPISPSAASTLSDQELVVAMAGGDERAASALYDRHGSAMFGLAVRMVGEAADAEEVVIDAFGQAWRDAARFDRSRGTVAGWLTTIVRTRALDLIRARSRRAKMTDTAASQIGTPVGMSEGFVEPDRQVSDAERASAVSVALDALPDAQRRVIELAFFEGLTHHEVSERLAEPLGTVKTRIRLGMQKLRDMLRDVAPERAG